MSKAQMLLDQFGGVARGMLLHEFGLSRRMLADAVIDGDIRRIRNGVFASHSADPRIVAAAGHGGSLTCAGALRMHGIWVLVDDDVPHVSMGSHGRVHHDRCSCVSHFYDGRTALGRAEVEDALVHLHACRGDEAFFVSLESALASRKLNAAGKARVRSRLPIGARWLVDLARVDAGSGVESLLRLRLLPLGIHLDCQVEIPGVGRVDFVIDGRLILEVDGAEFHSGRDAWRRDRRRDAVASALGYESLRISYDLILGEWHVVEAAIVAAIARARAGA
ncbi:MAG: DUF559 domain-containing protein [Microbacterium sp.]